MDSYKIWLRSFNDVSKFYDSGSCCTYGSLFDTYDMNRDSSLIFHSFEDEEGKSDFSIVEVDYLTSLFSSEEQLYDFLKKTRVDLNSNCNKKVTLTKYSNRLHNVKIIYNQPIIKSAASQVILDMKKGILYDDVLLELNEELIDFARNIRGIVACDSSFIAVAKICGASSKVINVLLDCSNDYNNRKSKNSYYAASKKLANCCRNYDNLRTLVVSILEYKKLKVNKMDSVDDSRFKRAFFEEFNNGFIDDVTLRYYFESSGLEGVVSNLPISKIYSFSVSDLRKIGFLPDICTDEELEEYKVYHYRRNYYESSLGDKCMNSSLRCDNSNVLDQIVGMRDNNGQINYDEVFATFDLEEILKVAPWLLQEEDDCLTRESIGQVNSADIDDISTLNYYRSGGQLNYEEIYLYLSLDDIIRNCDSVTLRELGIPVDESCFVKKHKFRKGFCNDE